MDFDTARMNEAAMENADEIIVLCVQRSSTLAPQVGYAEFRQVDGIITDSGLDGEKKMVTGVLRHEGDRGRTGSGVAGNKCVTENAVNRNINAKNK